MKYVALIPSYEPDDKLPAIINELHKSKFKIVLVNDGSDKSYDEVFAKCKGKCNYLTYSQNHGKGYALKTGLKYIKDKYRDCVVVTMDSDGQHKVSDAIKVCEEAKKKDETIVLGCRKRSGNTPLRSRLGNTITHFVYRACSGINIYDTQTGLRAFKSSLIPFLLTVEGHRFEYEMNMLLKCPKKNIKLIEVTIETIYENNNSGSHFNTIKDSYLIYKDMFKEILSFISSSFLSFLIDYVLYSMFIILTRKIVLSNILARAISSTFNYKMNKRIVFKDENKVKQSIFKYYFLALFVLTINTSILYVLVNVCSFDKYISKLIVEIVLFILSFKVQKKFIFKEEKL